MKAAAIKNALSGLNGAEVRESDYAGRGFHLSVSVAPEQVTAAAEIMDRAGFFIEAVTGVDWLGEKAALVQEAAKAAKAKADAAAKAAAEAGAGEAAPSALAPAPEEAPAAPPGEDEFEVVYDFNHYQELCRVAIRARVPRSNPELPTISAIYPGANWHERETHDFFGIRFAGHPDLSPLLLPEDADFHPLRKDYSA